MTEYTHPAEQEMSTARKLLTALGGRKIRAFLAGGLVLGLGATATLASYSDSEWVTSTFSADAVSVEPTPALKLEASHDNGTWSRDVTMTMSVNSDKMVTGSNYYAPIWLRLAEGTYLPGADRFAEVWFMPPSLEINPAGSTIASATRVQMFLPLNDRCDDQMDGGAVYLDETLASASWSYPASLTPGANVTTPGVARMFCLRFQLTQRPANEGPHSVTVDWRILTQENT